MTERALSENSIIELTLNGVKTEYRIDHVLGGGAGCIAYEVSYTENGNIPHKGILKEYCPAFLREYGFTRKNVCINIPDECKANFYSGKEDFKRAYRDINKFLADNISAMNFHTVQLGLLEGNNTAYTLVSYDYGNTYNKIEDTNLQGIFTLMLSVTKAVEMYHQAGYLHLDIKPKNILILDDVMDIVKLFDFDSITSLERLKSREVYAVPIPEDYYVPELKNFDLRNIGVQTDIYEIGATIYARIFKKNPTVNDVYEINKIDIDSSDFAVGVSPQAKFEIAELLKNTLQISRRKRYKSTTDLKAQLGRIISLLGAKEPYPLDMPKWQPTSKYVGRQKELFDIKKRLDKDGYVFVRGIGGLGKSELTKMFANTFAGEYHTVQFCKFNDSLRTVVASMPFDGINDDDYSDFNELVSTKNKVLHLCDEHTLIIVDNFNITYDEFLRDFLPASNKSFKVIFTTRCTPASDYYDNKVYDLPKLSEEECKTVFSLHAQITVFEENEELIEKLVKKTDRNTLIIILMACAIKKSGISISEMLDKLDNQELQSIGQKIFHEYDISNDEIKVYNAMYAHLNVIFSVSALSATQKEILKNATLISAEGLSVTNFVSFCDKLYINKNSVVELCDWGWLNIDSDEEMYMHPIISDLIAANESIKKEESYYYLAESLEDYCNPDYLSHISVVMDRLSCAIQLERRYKSEDIFKRCMITAKLGRMYQNAYYPTQAKKYLLKALKMAETERSEKGLPVSYKRHKNLKEKLILREVHITKNPNKMLLPFILFFLGGFEKDFGTTTSALGYYNRAIVEGKKIGFTWIMLVSKLEIAECYADNCNFREAYKEYVSAFKFARALRYKEYLTPIANDLVEICAQLELESEELKYRKFADKYKKYSEEETIEGLNEYTNAIRDGDFEESLRQYELFLAKQRENLGETSPMYKAFAKGLWVFYAINNQKEQALKYLNEAITFISSTYGENSMELAEQLAFAASFMPDLSEFDYAYNFANRAIEICNKNNEDKSYTYCEAKLALAHAAIVMGKVQEAEGYISNIDFSLFSGNEFLEDLIQKAGIVLANLSKYDDLEKMCLTLLSKKNVGNISKFQANILMSVVKEQQGDLSEAERYANESTQHIEFIKTMQVKDKWLIQYYRALARLDFRKGLNESAAKRMDVLFTLFENTNNNLLLYVAFVERGLYYSLCGNNTRAMQDFKQCEEILKNNHCPQEMFFLLYNNIAVNYQRICEYEKSMEYLNKAAKINPKVYNPTSYYETMVCGNIGWVSYLLGDINNGEKYLSAAVKSFEKLGSNKSKDYFIHKCNLSTVYVALNKCDAALDMFFDIRQRFNPASDVSGEFANNTCEGIMDAYFKSGKAQQAYKFACQEVIDLEQWFGKYSIIRIKEIINMGVNFRANGYTDCYDFFMSAAELLYNSDQTKTLQYALVLNFIGVCILDYEKKYYEANLYFKDSKELFEELGETDNDNYRVVLKNIEYVAEMSNKELIKKLANSLGAEDNNE